ncbi:MAG: PDZ domain-containing protein [Deltaproteobacteria bacterium]|nr:PDZ domain-containing protein [Deltaproteobacteria bacterium]
MLLAATLLRRHATLLHLLLLALAALLAARLLSVLGGLALLRACELAPPTAPSTTSSPSAARERDFDPALGVALFGAAPRAPQALDEVAGSCDEAPDTTLPLRLVGASVFLDPALSLASIVHDERGGAVAEVYGPGDAVGDDARLLAIADDHACIENLRRGGFERVTTSAPAGGAAPSSTRTAPRAPGPTGDAVLDELLTGARALPRFEGGKLTGVRLSGIRPGSLYQRAGLMNGDTVVAIDGATADNLGDALELWARVKTQRSVEVSVLRKGAPLTLTVAVPTP